jgi:hypothetical protein
MRFSLRKTAQFHGNISLGSQKVTLPHFSFQIFRLKSRFYRLG